MSTVGRIGSKRGELGIKISAAMIYGAESNVTGSISPGETVLVLSDRTPDKYCKILWHSGTWWVHGAFIEVLDDEVRAG